MPLARPMTLLLLVATTTLVYADEARIPIYKAVTITQSGHYIVTRDVSAPAPVVVAANNVVIDLQGHTLAVSSGNLAVITLQDGFTDLTVRNGELSSPGAGLAALGTSVATALHLDSVTFASMGASAVVVQLASDVEVRHCTFRAVGGHAIYLLQGTGKGTVQITDNAMTDLDGHGLSAAGANASFYVARNTIATFGKSAPAFGIYVSGAAIVENNIVRDGTSDDRGIRVYSGSIVRGNVVTSCGAAGIRVEGGNTLVEDNNAWSNTCGLDFLIATSAYRDNMLRGNTNAVCGAATDAGGNVF